MLEAIKSKKSNTGKFLAIGGAALAAYLIFRKNGPTPPPPPPADKANLYGRVTSAGIAVPSAQVSVGSTTTLSDTNGDYILNNLELGEVIVTCSKAGYTTASQVVTLTAGNIREDIVLIREAQAVLQVENLQVSPSFPLIGQQVLVSLIGTTDISGTYSLSMKINGVVVQTKSIEITAGEAKIITFTYSPASAGIYSVQVSSLTGQFEAVEGLLCYNDGLLFATQADLNAHINTVHPSLPTAPLIIRDISWGSNSIDLSSGRLVGLQNNMWIYLLDNQQAPQLYGPVAITLKTLNLWIWFAPSDFPEIEVRANVLVGKFGDIGSNPFNAFVGSSGAPILYLVSGGTLPGRTGDSGKTFTMMTSAGLGPLQPGLYDIMVNVTMSGAGQGIFAYMPMSSYNYVIPNAWRAL